jgi:hypothetical protein
VSGLEREAPAPTVPSPAQRLREIAVHASRSYAASTSQISLIPFAVAAVELHAATAHAWPEINDELIGLLDDAHPEFLKLCLHYLHPPEVVQALAGRYHAAVEANDWRLRLRFQDLMDACKASWPSPLDFYANVVTQEVSAQR